MTQVRIFSHYTDWFIGILMSWPIVIPIQLGSIIPSIEQIIGVLVTAHLGGWFNLRIFQHKLGGGFLVVTVTGPKKYLNL